MGCRPGGLRDVLVSGPQAGAVPGGEVHEGASHLVQLLGEAGGEAGQQPGGKPPGDRVTCGASAHSKLQHADSTGESL